VCPSDRVQKRVGVDFAVRLWAGEFSAPYASQRVSVNDGIWKRFDFDLAGGLVAFSLCDSGTSLLTKRGITPAGHLPVVRAAIWEFVKNIGA
jgi:hypothetical protein